VLKQSWMLVSMAVRTMPTRVLGSGVAVIGFAGVATVLVAILALRANAREAYVLSSRDDVAVVLQNGARNELMSSLAPELVWKIPEMPGVAGAGAQSAVSPEFVSNGVQVPTDDPNGVGIPVTGRGITEAAPSLRADFRIVEGRMFQSGRNEAIVGRGLVSQYPALRPGAHVRVRRTELRIVGIFDARGPSIFEVWADKTILQGASQVYGQVNPIALSVSSSAWVRLSSPDGLRSLNDALASFGATANRIAEGRPASAQAIPEGRFLELQSGVLIRRITSAAVVVALAMGMGAVFGAVNAMYAVVSARLREIAIVRAMGFQAGPILQSILAEAIVLALIGSAAGVGIAHLMIQDMTASLLGAGGGSLIGLQFTITPGVIATTLAYTTLLSVISSILPCVRSMRTPIPAALASPY
jgi:putative ABC transport system permease protein